MPRVRWSMPDSVAPCVVAAGRFGDVRSDATKGFGQCGCGPMGSGAIG